MKNVCILSIAGNKEQGAIVPGENDCFTSVLFKIYKSPPNDK